MSEPRFCYYTAAIQGRTLDPRDGVTYFQILVTEDSARQWHVARRYSDFERLAKMLQMQLPGLPPMPPKSFFRRMCLPSFMSEREVALGNILRFAVHSDPQLRSLLSLRQFLGLPLLTSQAPGPQGATVGVAVDASAPPMAMAQAEASAPPVPMAQAVHVAAAAPASQVVQGTPIGQPACEAVQAVMGCPSPAYAQQSPGYTPAVYAQPGGGLHNYAQPGALQPGYVQPSGVPVAAQPACAQPTYQPSDNVRPGYTGYAQPAYQQPVYAQPAYAQPVYQQYPEPGYHYQAQGASSSGGMGTAVGVGLAAGAAGLVGGMLLEGALDHRRRDEFILPDRGITDGPMFMGGPGPAEVIIDRDAFGDVVREEVIYDDGW